MKVLSLALPRLAKGWERQRGDEYGFGVNPDPLAKDRVSAMDQEKLKAAPVNNLDPERSVGSINHERKVRGASQLEAASRAHVSGKGAELIDGEVTDSKFRKISSPDGEMTSIMREWKTKQEALAEEGLDAKTVANLATDRQRNNDLTILKDVDGPFTTAASVDEYLASGLPDTVMNKRLYIEVIEGHIHLSVLDIFSFVDHMMISPIQVRHAKNTSLSYPKKSEIFRLKKASKNLSTDTYSTNLKAYLNKLAFHVNMNPDDFDDALNKLSF